MDAVEISPVAKLNDFIATRGFAALGSPEGLELAKAADVDFADDSICELQRMNEDAELADGASGAGSMPNAPFPAPHTKNVDNAGEAGGADGDVGEAGGADGDAELDDDDAVPAELEGPHEGQSAGIIPSFTRQKPKKDQLVGEYFRRHEFSNWGQTVKSKSLVYHPGTTTDVENAMREAATKLGAPRRVRAVGAGHTWTSFFWDEKDDAYVTKPEDSSAESVLLYMMPIAAYDDSSTDLTSYIATDDTGATEHLTSIGKPVLLPDDPDHALVRLGAATTMEQLRDWSVRHNEWCIPFNAIIVEITVGGSNATICHGAGSRSRTLSDLVEVIEWVDSTGNRQILKRGELDVDGNDVMNAAAGAFGLLGVVTHLTMRFDKATATSSVPLKLPTIQAIPPLAPSDAPARFNVKNQDANEAKHVFEKNASESYYSEWFHFPNWDTRPVSYNDITDYPTVDVVNAQKARMMFARNLFDAYGAAKKHVPTLLQGSRVVDRSYKLMRKTVVPVFAASMMDSFPAIPLPQVLIPNAMHFQRGVHRYRVRDMEVEVPIPQKRNKSGELLFKDDGSAELDWDIVRELWWKAITYMTEKADKHEYPVDVTLEMRMVGGSDITMAPFRGNLATASIEVLSTTALDDDEWMKARQDIYTMWAGVAATYRDQNGQPLRVCPHWAKEWQGITVGDAQVPLELHLRDVVYKDAIPLFVAQMDKICQSRGNSFVTEFDRFSNLLLQTLYGGEVDRLRA